MFIEVAAVVAAGQVVPHGLFGEDGVLQQVLAVLALLAMAGTEAGQVEQQQSGGAAGLVFVLQAEPGQARHDGQAGAAQQVPRDAGIGRGEQDAKGGRMPAGIGFAQGIAEQEYGQVQRQQRAAGGGAAARL